MGPKNTDSSVKLANKEKNQRLMSEPLLEISKKRNLKANRKSVEKLNKQTPIPIFKLDKRVDVKKQHQD